MLAHVSQKIEHIDVSRPIQIVHHKRRVIAFKINKLADLLTDFLDPPTNDLWSVELALGRFEAGITNQTGRAAYQRNGAMARLLKTTQHQ